MAISPTNMFSMLDQRMHHNALSARVASENMANLNTPGYKARQVTPLSTNNTFQVALQCTHPMHLHGGHEAGQAKIVEDPTGVAGLTGNTVSYAHELQKANQAHNWHAQSSQIVTSYLSTLGEVLKRS